MKCPPFTDCALKVLGLVLLLACSQEKQRDPGEPTPYELYVARERLRGHLRTPVDTGQSATTKASTGDADHDFLRAMSTHHKNVITLAKAVAANKNLDLEGLAEQLEERHGHELDTLTVVLRNAYQDRSISLHNDETRRTAQFLRDAGPGYKQNSLNAVIKAEQDAVRIAKAYLPKGKRADVKHLAARIEGNETEEIVAIRKLLPQEQR